MGERLKADIGRIREASEALKRIHDEFDHSGDIVHGYHSVIGSGLLADRLDDFSSNWKAHRVKLTEELKKLSELTEAAAKAYHGIDEELAKALREQKDKKGGE